MILEILLSAMITLSSVSVEHRDPQESFDTINLEDRVIVLRAQHKRKPVVEEEQK